MKKIKTSEAVGLVLAYDITEVNPSENFKGRAFKRGYIIRQEDVEKLESLGRFNIFVEDGNDNEVHENDFAMLAAELAPGINIKCDDEPSEGKVSFYAESDGLFQVDYDRLLEINMLGTPSFPTIHNNFPVSRGKQVAAFRIIPLTAPKETFDRVKEILSEPIIKIKPYIYKTASILVTGSEVHSGKIKDGFAPRLKPKLESFGVKVINSETAPDDMDYLINKINQFSSESDILLITGGTSVDPDDITSEAMHRAGIKFEVKGNPIQPGNNLTIGYKDGKPVCAVPAAALMFHATALDIFLPRLLTGEMPAKEEIAAAGHGGLCHFCKKCVFPICPFGRGGF